MENRKIRIENAVIIVPSETKMSIAEIADLFDIYYRTAKREIRAIEKQRSTERSVVKSGVANGYYSGSCAVEGSKIYPDYYGLEMVIAVAFRVRSANAEVFRRWICRSRKNRDLQNSDVLDSKFNVELILILYLFSNLTNRQAVQTKVCRFLWLQVIYRPISVISAYSFPAV